MSNEGPEDTRPIWRPGDDPWLDGASKNNRQRYGELKGIKSQRKLTKKEQDELKRIIDDEREYMRKKVARNQRLPEPKK